MLQTLRARRGMVVAPHHLAAQAGRDVLRDGGNAIEAAVATAACLAVVYPHMTGIGGDGFWLMREPDGRVHAIDACGRAARAATLDFYRGHTSIPWRGPGAANTVAGTVSGWALALQHADGTLPLQRVLSDAIHHANAGTPVTLGGAQIAASKRAELCPQPGAYAEIFEPHGTPLREGALLQQPQLAHTLQRLADEGLESFYRGALAHDIAADLQVLGSPLSADDLAAHHAEASVPLSVAIHGARLYNHAPPTQGLASLLILALFDRLRVEEADSSAHLHGLIEATKQAFLIRDAHIGDPAWMTLDAQALLDDSAALDALAARIDMTIALPWPQPSQAGDTVWFGAIDAHGRAVSCIQSTYFEFGSGLVLPRTGITWQNRGCSFRLATDGWNALAPGRKPFHTLNPALATFDDGRVMAYGTMGGEGQPQTQAAVFSRYARFGMPLQQAITAPRWLLGRTWGEDSTTLKLEDRFDPAVVQALRDAGHAVELLPAYASVMGHAGALVREADGVISGASDPRSDGAVAAW
ncbi:gamma-glutamyltransferase family protein [Xanthomonas prunicola]|uniref:gamma-glutamyltransferase family protein n=1 Tax=Xanthomonas prunicola TaxID=2053930 RepID=UPI0021B3758E|nr:gamma-glutamyltransferase family protein [Xanthomonas prunicola]UXA51565.1 gamma-glutamyltransferase family protein [Xanthomonas prunicola]UXA70703.1 gamma-glutamyltransferase family protein [Xanthomonas prunicola]